MSHLKVVRPATEAQKATHTTLDTIEVTPDLVKSWLNPPFQRGLKVNEKVRELAEEIKQTEVIPGVLTLGILTVSGKREVYLLDGQHRREAFLIAGVKEGYCDVRMRHFAEMDTMGEEFVDLNTAIKTLKPDDILRGLEGSNESLTLIRKRCPFVGYEYIRRNESAPLLSMAQLLRAWHSATCDTPSSRGMSAMNLARGLTVAESQDICEFIELAHAAWGRDGAYARLWGSLNLSLVMWLYRRITLAPVTKGNSRVVTVNKQLFGRCLMSLSADNDYADWLLGRQLGERDRSPAYGRIKAIFAKRLQMETGQAWRLPQPPWASHLSNR